MEKQPIPNLSFLESKGFKVVNLQQSKSFGDFVLELESLDFFLKYSKDRSISSVDIMSTNDKNNWYELDLIKAFVNNEVLLTKKNSQEELALFLETNFDRLVTLFNGINYAHTKVSLELMKAKRFKQMFPL